MGLLGEIMAENVAAFMLINLKSLLFHSQVYFSIFLIQEDTYSLCLTIILSHFFVVNEEFARNSHD